MDDHHRRELRAVLQEGANPPPQIDIHDNQITIHQHQLDAEVVDRLLTAWAQRSKTNTA